MASIELGQADNGRHIEVRKGDVLVVRLPENPTTGARWAVDQDGGLVEPEGAQFDPSGGKGIGAGGLRTLRFKATATGEGQLRLKMWQAWEGDASISARYELGLRVTD
jgi:predicted secreted protein